MTGCLWFMFVYVCWCLLVCVLRLLRLWLALFVIVGDIGVSVFTVLTVAVLPVLGVLWLFISLMLDLMFGVGLRWLV